MSLSKPSFYKSLTLAEKIGDGGSYEGTKELKELRTFEFPLTRYQQTFWTVKDSEKDRKCRTAQTSKTSNENGAVAQRDAEKWRKDMEEVIQDMEPKHIPNMDDMRLFYKCTSDKTLAFKNEKCNGGKLSKERVTLLVVANTDGSKMLEKPCQRLKNQLIPIVLNNLNLCQRSLYPAKKLG
ncbi:hypothetical protein J437_LFUL014736 [Ladona fulva]|uniref:Uncharacterized protein n=1 Tax=Ladona fulva TaxID=123851 RepID=A0A8K0P960_LADFU|nr:hypothetical protein J437_LFUL014736 [Ladona fulva]